MKTPLLLILLACAILATGQNRPRPQYPLDVLCPTTTVENRAKGYVLNSQVAAIELPSYPQDAQGNRGEGQFAFVQVVVNENGDVIAATPVEGKEELWAASVKAAVTARFDPKTLAKEPGKLTGILMFYFSNGKVELPTWVPVRRGISNPFSLPIPKPTPKP